MTNFKELSDKELLSTIIYEHEGEMVSSQLLQSFSSLPGLLVDSLEEELVQIKGIGSKRAKQIKAIYELMQRLSRYPGTNGRFIKCPQDLYDLLMLEMRFLKKEVFKAILLNTKNRILEVIDVSMGSLNSSIVHPREVYIYAIKM
jgi:DNA repair protein RadC